MMMISADAEWLRRDQPLLGDLLSVLLSVLTSESPGIAASFRRPGASLAAEQRNLAGVITVVCGDLPQRGVHRGLAGVLIERSTSLTTFVERVPNPRFGQRASRASRSDETLAHCVSTASSALGFDTCSHLRMRRPAFDRLLRILRNFARNIRSARSPSSNSCAPRSARWSADSPPRSRAASSAEISSTQATGSTWAPLPYTSSRNVVSPIGVASFSPMPGIAAQ